MEAVWAPQPGPQAEAIASTWCDELFFGGARGGGKSDYLLGDFLQDVFRFASDWHGVIFRRTYAELEELIRRSHEFFPATGAKWYVQDKTWWWENGASLKMRYLDSFKDIGNYQGHSYTWIGFDELTQWPDESAYLALSACLRWGRRFIPTKRIRCSGNPGGPGHQWVKARFVDLGRLGFVAFLDPKTMRKRMFIPSKLRDNKILTTNDPGYELGLHGVGNEALVKAWLDGDWDIVAGAYFTEFGTKNIVAPVALPRHLLRFGSFDWGSYRPFSMGWWAVSDGLVEYKAHDGKTKAFPKNSIIRYREWYGSSAPNVGLRPKMTAEQIADGIILRQLGDTLSYIVADSSMWDEDGGPSKYERMWLKGLPLRKSDKKRIAGWDMMRARIVGVDDEPMLYTFSTCRDSIRTIPALQHDENNLEDVDSEGEDHAADDWRYACMSRPWSVSKVIPRPVRELRNLTADDLVPLQGGNSGRI